MAKQSRNPKILTLVLAVAFLLRLISVNQSFWLDEAIGAIAVKNFNYHDLIYKFMPADNHSPLYYLLLKFWTDLFGYSELAVRSLGISASVFAIIFTYKLSNLLFKNKNLALFSALFLSTSQFYIYYTQEARMYGVTSLFSVAAVYFLSLAIKNENQKKYWPAYSVSVAALVFSDYVPAFFLPVLFFYPLLFNLKQKKIFYIKFILAHLPILILGIFWLPIFQEQLQNGRFILTKLPQWKAVAGGASFKNLVHVWTKFSLGRISLVNKKAYAAIILLSSLIYLPIMIKSLKHKKVLYLLTVPIIITFLASVFFPAFIYFRFTYLYPFFAILISASVFSFKKNFRMYFGALLIVINIFALLIYYFDVNQQREQWRQAVSFVEEVAEDDSIVLFAFSDAPAPYIWYQNSIVEYAGATNSISADRNETIQKTEELIENRETIYFFEYLRDLSDPNHIVESTLTESGFEVVQVYNQFKGGMGQIFKWQK